MPPQDGGCMNDRQVELIECEWCGNTCDLYETKFLVFDRVICGSCLIKTNEELGIEPLESEE